MNRDRKLIEFATHKMKATRYASYDEQVRAGYENESCYYYDPECELCETDIPGAGVKFRPEFQNHLCEECYQKLKSEDNK